MSRESSEVNGVGGGGPPRGPRRWGGGGFGVAGRFEYLYSNDLITLLGAWSSSRSIGSPKKYC